MNPPDRRDIVDYLASLDDTEYAKLRDESRGTNIRDSESRGTNIRDSIDNKSARLAGLINRTNSDGYQQETDQ